MSGNRGFEERRFKQIMDSGLIKWVKRFVPKPIKEMLKQLIIPYPKERLKESSMPPLESLPDAPDLFQVYRHLHQHPDLKRKPGGWLYKDEFYPDYLTVGGTSHAIFRQAIKFCQGEGIDIGAGLWPLPGAIPVDIQRGPGLAKKLPDFSDGSLDYVFSSHCLEHIENWRGALREWLKKLKPGGKIFLYLPHPYCAIWHPGSPMVGEGHKWIPTPEVIKQALRELLCEIIQFDDGPDVMQSFFVCGRK
jgi:SAM-dependent methyltransferase